MACSYGGQALIEGVMMRGKRYQAMSARLEDGRIVSEVEEFTMLTDRHKFFGLPFIRGTFNMIDSLISGMKALTWSTNVSLAEDEDEEELTPMEIAMTMIVSIGLGILLFFVLPVVIAHYFQPLIPGNFLQNIFEGVVRVVVFLLYLFLISRMKEIRRVFQYHGAEHKSIHCYEAGEALTPENAMKHTRLHPRCGTSFLFIVMVISIFVFALVGVENFAWRMASRIVLLPVIAGVSYEVLRYCGKHMDKAWVRAIAWPGMQLQRLTTGEPDLEMLEVAIYSLQKVRAREEDETLDPDYKKPVSA
ncbi:MAG: DUF1385 domain-containing protein [Peptococcaceae bacterium]|jgi:uncharacterized protein YqhQ|nr:DUF1385 domain-containing protein [Peptococcaceae bacterium]